MATLMKRSYDIRVLVSLPLGIAALFGAMYVHEGFHLIFIIPPGGELADWHWWPAGWSNVRLSPDPWGTIALYSGGLGAGLLLASCLSLTIWRYRQRDDWFWWWLSAPLAFGTPTVLFTGISEGGFNDFYGSTLFSLLTFGIGIIGVIL